MADFKAQVEKLMHHIGALRDRWTDEHEYEDWGEYVASVKNELPSQTTFVNMSKRPFAVTFDYMGKRHIVKATAAHITHVVAT